MSEEHPAVIIDNGATNCKAGIAGDDAPRCCFPAVVGRPQNQEIMFGCDFREAYVAEEAQAKIGYPNINCIVNDWDSINFQLKYRHGKNLAHALFNELRVSPEDHPVLIADIPLSPKKQREKMAQMMFQTFNVPKFYLKSKVFYRCRLLEELQVLLLTVEGKLLTQCRYMERINIAGNACTKYLSTLLNELGIEFESSADMEILRDMKEKLDYVALDYEDEIKKRKCFEQQNI